MTKKVQDELPRMPVIKRTRRMPKGIRRRPYEYVDAGKYRHQHRFTDPLRDEKQDWHLVRKWKGEPVVRLRGELLHLRRLRSEAVPSCTGRLLSALWQED